MATIAITDEKKKHVVKQTKREGRMLRVAHAALVISRIPMLNRIDSTLAPIQ